MTLNSTSTTTLPTTERQQQIEAICLRLLAMREHSQRELFDKLALRGFARDEVESIISRLAEQDWQNDARYAEAYVRQRIAKGYGPVRIAHELQQRGIRDVDVQTQAEEQGGWLQLALGVYLAKYDDAMLLAPNEWLKRSRFLQQRGFNGDTIKGLLLALNIKLQK